MKSIIAVNRHIVDRKSIENDVRSDPASTSCGTEEFVSLSGELIGNPFRSDRNRELVHPFRWFKPWDNTRCILAILARQLQYSR